MNLDDFGVFNEQSKMKTPLIISDAHADYLYETFCPSRLLDKQIERKLNEEKAEKAELEKQHKMYCERNYIRVGKTKEKGLI